LGLLPKSLRGWQRIDVELSPPNAFVAATMELAMVMPTDGNSVFVTDFTPHRSPLRELEVMRIGRLTTAGEARLGTNEFQMLAIAATQRLAQYDYGGDGGGLWRVVREFDLM
jgi:hypothetical protein